MSSGTLNIIVPVLELLKYFHIKSKPISNTMYDIYTGGPFIILLLFASFYDSWMLHYIYICYCPFSGFRGVHALITALPAIFYINDSEIFYILTSL